MEYEEYTYYPLFPVHQTQASNPPSSAKSAKVVQKAVPTPAHVKKSPLAPVVPKDPLYFLDGEERALYYDFSGVDIVVPPQMAYSSTPAVIKSYLEQQQQKRSMSTTASRGIESEISVAKEVSPQESEGGEPAGEKKLSKAQLKKLEKEQKKKETAERLAAEKAAADANDCSKEFYGDKPLNMSQERSGAPRTLISDLNESLVNKNVLINVRVQNSSAKGKQLFLVLRQGKDTVQGILAVDNTKVSKQMLKWASGISNESIVLIDATVVKTPEPVKRCTVQLVELKIHKIYRTSAAERLPFGVEDAARPESEFVEQEKLPETESKFSRVNLDTRLDNRIIDLRTITNHSIFRVQSAISLLFREFLDSERFIEIHSPKIIGAASEGGANVFKVSYFKTDAYLAQSPQFYKQMCICADFERVYEIAPVFRAELSFSHRHMTEFMGLDLEMAFEEHYHEVLDLFDDLFIFIFENLEKRYGKELEIVGKQYPFEKFVYLPTKGVEGLHGGKKEGCGRPGKCLRLEYKDAIALLRAAGRTIGDEEDMNTETERFLGSLVKEKFGTDFYMLDKFPLSIRPFYTMPDPHNQVYSNSYDFFIRGEEILSGAQRIHDPKLLTERVKAHGVDPATIQPYLDSFKYGTPPHAGGGIGLERVVMLYLNLGNIRRTSLFPRDPKRLNP
ncbi:aspartate--tRNA ligase dps1 [Nowakowskiella sp. JEL0407]|nr:aspartate--tRNA ligase dps1 [Nowakowskiella sp. JEL0407]